MAKSKSKKKLIITLIVIFVLALIGAGLFIGRTLLTKSNSTDTVYIVREETYENIIEISGTVSAAQSQTLQALSSGTVTGVFVKAGDKVKKGDVLIQLDDTTEKYNLAKHDYDMDTTKISGSRRQLELMETQRNALIRKVEDRKVTATFDGIIAELDVAVGDSLEAKDSVGVIVNKDYLTAEVEVAETDVSKLKVNQKVLFTFPAMKNETVTGYVVSWPAVGEITSRGATVVKAKVRIDEYPEQILPNYSFTGKIELSPTETNIVVERWAIGYDENKQAYVELARTGQRIDVEVKNYGNQYVKVLSGLKGNEVLKQLTVPKQSGWNRQNGNKGGQGQFPGGAPGGMGGGSGSRSGSGGGGGMPPAPF